MFDVNPVISKDVRGSLPGQRVGSGGNAQTRGSSRVGSGSAGILTSQVGLGPEVFKYRPGRAGSR